MSIQTAYNAWADTYDTVLNKTRDLEAVAIRQLLAKLPFAEVIELGCGTGKNTEWLATKAAHVTAVDFSAEMLARAQAKLAGGNVRFQQADVTQPWSWAQQPAELVTSSLILEHIADMGPVFRHCSQALRPGGWFYVGELHPFKQYQGSKARYLAATGAEVTVECYTHHLSDFLAAARPHGFRCLDLREYFDDNDRTAVPRIVSFLFQKEA
ncbi:class I SAM-dependent methyltransferase [Hymenobacter sp. 5317J-9]|uniref:class I SAM-dependent DNA methyltransferase n=1 Tax=Hymenobacter sp. 5317J-9 TaxID=2932250 RepID=UPI001FD64E74|nr:class I SAM-dependent methyltransferase [Hymenobacter sp. 5317J-9]UOQ97011.1 class I SAM-dependent methyltransferase [Hymenobacter sp. 5317J-9]